MAESDKLQTVTSPFGLGVNEGVEHELLGFGESHVVVENARIEKMGGLVKRNGFSSVEPASTSNAFAWSYASRMFAHQESVATINGWDTSLSFVDGAGTHAAGVYAVGSYLGGATNLGPISSCFVERESVAPITSYSSTAGMRFCDVAVGDSHTCTIYVKDSESGTGSYAGLVGKRYVMSVITENATGAVVSTELSIARLLDSGTATRFAYPKITTSAGRFFVFYQPFGAASEVHVAIFDATTIAGIKAGWLLVGNVAFVAGRTDPYNFDVCTPSASNGFILTYQTNTDYLVQIHDTAGTLVSSVFVSSAGTVGKRFAISCSSGVVWLAVLKNVSQVQCTGLNESGLTTLYAGGNVIVNMPGPPTRPITAIGIVGIDTTTCFVSASYFQGETRWAYAVGSAGVTTSSSGGFGCGVPWVHIASKPWVYRGRVFMAVFPIGYLKSSVASVIQPYNPTRNLWVIDATYTDAGQVAGCAVPVANIAPRAAMFFVNDYIREPSPATTGDYSVPLLNSNPIGAKASFGLVVQESNVTSSAQVVSLDFASSRRWDACEGVDGTVIACGVPAAVVKSRVFDVCFLETGQICRVTNAADAAGFQGNVNYIAVYQWTDPSGNVHRSAPSSPVNSLSGVNSAFTVEIPSIGVTSKLDTYATDASSTSNLRPYAIVYRTGDGGVTYYRVGAVELTGASTVTFVDKMDHVTLLSQELLYRQPGEIGATLPHVCPPSFQTVTSHLDRVFGVAEDGTTVWFSSKKIPGEGQWFSDIFQFQIESGGHITALASLDGRLYVFKRNEIWAVEGDGPAENGSNGEYAPYRLPNDVGCIDSRSVAALPGNLMFQSFRGIESLSRGQQGGWVGEPVQDQLEAYPEITSAVVDAARGVVLFTCRSASSGVTLVFDYLLGKWTIDRVSSSANGVADTYAVHACLSGDGTYFRSIGSSLEKSSSGFLDGTTWITTRIVTPWAKTAGIFGEQDVPQVLALFRNNGASDVTMSVGYNYRTEYESSEVWRSADLTDIAQKGAPDTIELMLGNERRGQSVRIKVEDSAPVVNIGAVYTKANRFIALACMVQGRAAKYAYKTEIR